MACSKGKRGWPSEWSFFRAELSRQSYSKVAFSHERVLSSANQEKEKKRISAKLPSAENFVVSLLYSHSLCTKQGKALVIHRGGQEKTAYLLSYGSSKWKDAFAGSISAVLGRWGVPGKSHLPAEMQQSERWGCLPGRISHGLSSVGSVLYSWGNLSILGIINYVTVALHCTFTDHCWVSWHEIITHGTSSGTPPKEYWDSAVAVAYLHGTDWRRMNLHSLLYADSLWRLVRRQGHRSLQLLCCQWQEVCPPKSRQGCGPCSERLRPGQRLRPQ